MRRPGSFLIACSVAGTLALLGCDVQRYDTGIPGHWEYPDAAPDVVAIDVMACTPTASTCDGTDNDCDGQIDEADEVAGEPGIGEACFGGEFGVCALAEHAGSVGCVDGVVRCAGDDVILPNELPEECNGEDDDCNGTVDDNPHDAGEECGASNIYPCSLGVTQCIDSEIRCVGAVLPGVELCNGIDDDCDGEIDGTGGQPPLDAQGECDAPPDPPAGATTPCVAGHLACIGGTIQCLDAVGPETATDGCNDDSNCNGLLEGQPDLDSDVNHCGSCSNDCTQGALHAIWTCESGGCVFNGCEPGWHDTQGNQTCDYYCVPTGPEVCNHVDDDCDGDIDEDVVPPPNARVNICGVSPAAQRAECTTQVGVTCVDGVWQCAFPANVCNPTCAGATEVCDALDNDCDGLLNENVSNFGRACLSDEGLPAPGHGACQTSGTYVCDGASATRCTAVKASCATLPGGCEEKCDGIDNDCDGLVDEDYTDKGTEAAYFVKPAVVQVAASVWMFAYEASRPNATSIDAGSGNGYHCSAGTCPAGVPDPPSGKPLERTLACSVPGKIPWFNVSPIEAEHTCAALGGYLCTRAEWTTACQAREGGQNCLYGYAPNDAACRSASTATKYCNLAAFDTDTVTAGNQDAVIVTASPGLQMCYADWGSLLTNPASAPLYDITGNLREITEASAGVYKLMGGSFITPTHDGATCTFEFYAVDGDTLAYDAGFRCCFGSDPRL